MDKTDTLECRQYRVNTSDNQENGRCQQKEDSSVESWLGGEDPAQNTQDNYGSTQEQQTRYLKVHSNVGSTIQGFAGKLTRTDDTQNNCNQNHESENCEWMQIESAKGSTCRNGVQQLVGQLFVSFVLQHCFDKGKYGPGKKTQCRRVTDVGTDVLTRGEAGNSNDTKSTTNDF